MNIFLLKTATFTKNIGIIFSVSSYWTSWCSQNAPEYEGDGEYRISSLLKLEVERAHINDVIGTLFDNAWKPIRIKDDGEHMSARMHAHFMRDSQNLTQTVTPEVVVSSPT